MRRCRMLSTLRQAPSSLPALRACYPHQQRHTVEPSDLNPLPLKYVNADAYFACFERIRKESFQQLMSECPASVAPVLAELDCSFKRPVLLGDVLHIGLRVDSVRPSEGQFRHQYSVWSQQHNAIAAQGGATIVMVDIEDGGGQRTPVPERLVHRIEVEFAESWASAKIIEAKGTLSLGSLPWGLE